MTSRKEAHLDNARRIHVELLEVISGMDYCLDWKPDPETWSAREVLYHLLETPPGGFHQALKGVLSGELPEFELWSDLTNITPERLARDMEQVKQEIDDFFQGMAGALESVPEGDFEGKSILVHQRNRGWDEPRTAQNLLEGLFARHWGEHLGQLRELRDALGM